MEVYYKFRGHWCGRDNMSIKLLDVLERTNKDVLEGRKMVTDMLS